LRVYS